MARKQTSSWLRHACWSVAVALPLGSHPAQAQLSANLAECASVRANSAAAIAACSRVIESGQANSHNLTLSYFNRGTAWGLMGHTDRSISDLNQAIRIEPGFAPAYNNRGLAFSKTGEGDRALADFNQAIALNPVHQTAYVSRGNAYGRRCDPDRAMADFERAIQLGPNSAPAYVGRGWAWLSKGDANRAIADATTAIRLRPDFAPAFAMRAAAHTRLRELDRAMADAEQAVSLDPKLAGAYNARGSIHGIRNELDKAVAEFDRALQLDPWFAAAYSNRGVAFRQKGERDRAIADHDRAIQISRTCAGPYNNRAYAYVLKGELPRALSDADTSISLNPHVAAAYATRGTVHRRLGNHALAIRDLTEATRLDSSLASAFTERGLSYQSQGDLARARADFKAALALPLKAPADKQWHDTARDRLASIDQPRAVATPTASRSPDAAPARVPANHAPSRTQSMPAPGGGAATPKPLREALADCNKAAGDTGPLTLPGADGDIKLHQCYRGSDHLVCSADALATEAQAIKRSYREVADARYSDMAEIDAICRIEPAILASHLNSAKGFDARWDVLKTEYGSLADCSNLVEESIRNVILPDVPRGADIVKSMIAKIRVGVRRVSETQKDVSDLADAIRTSKKALTTFENVRVSMCSRKPS